MTPSEIEALGKLDFFEQLDPKILRAIASQCFRRQFPPGEVIMRQGESGLGLYVIVDGKVRIDVENGGTITSVAELGPGNCVGELAIVDNKARSASVICIEPTTCLLLTRDSFSKLMNKHPQIAQQMVYTLAARLRASNARTQPAPPPSPQPAPVIVPVAAPAPSFNPTGTLVTAAGEVLDVYSSTKGKIRDALLDAFTPLFAARAITQFSMAVVGCPVTVRAENDATLFEVGGLKICMLPPDGEHALHIDAYDDGDMSISVLRPGSIERLNTHVRCGDRHLLRIPSEGPLWLNNPR